MQSLLRPSSQVRCMQSGSAVHIALQHRPPLTAPQMSHCLLLARQEGQRNRCRTGQMLAPRQGGDLGPAPGSAAGTLYATLPA